MSAAEDEVPEKMWAAAAFTEKNTIMPTTSSSTAIGRSVSVTGPSVWNSRTIERAVARAMLPMMRPRKTGTFSMRKMTMNAADTTAKVSRDWVRVVVMRALPNFRIFLHTSSVPSMRPKATCIQLVITM